MTLMIHTILISDSLLDTMITKICTEIMKVRQVYGARRTEMIRRLANWSRMSLRRERARKIRASSRKSVYNRLAGLLRKGDRDDIQKLDKVVTDNKGDIKRTMRCLREATFYLDDVVLNPKLIRNARYKSWQRALDFFLSEMRDLVEYKNCPGQYEVDILECLITRLSLMRINETLDEQIILRINLEDVVKTLFSVSREQKCRLMGF